MSLFSVVMLALSSIIGSGWLFGAWEASKVWTSRNYLMGNWCYRNRNHRLRLHRIRNNVS